MFCTRVEQNEKSICIDWTLIQCIKCKNVNSIQVRNKNKSKFIKNNSENINNDIFCIICKCPRKFTRFIEID